MGKHRKRQSGIFHGKDYLYSTNIIAQLLIFVNTAIKKTKGRGEGVYVNYGLLSNQKASFLIGWVVDHIPRIYYTGYYKEKENGYWIFPYYVACPGNYEPAMFKKRFIPFTKVKKGY